MSKDAIKKKKVSKSSSSTNQPKSKPKKHAGGRPSKFDSINLKQVYDLATFGATEAQIVVILGICEKTLANYKNKHPEFLQTIKKGKEVADSQVVKSLYQRATGYVTPETKVFCNSDGVVTTETIEKHYAPDATAICFWLKNRQHKHWKDRNHLVNEGKLSLEVTPEQAKKISKYAKK